MSKALIVGAVVVGAVVLAKRHALSRDGFDIESFIERMPDTLRPSGPLKHQRDPREHRPDPGDPGRAEGHV